MSDLRASLTVDVLATSPWHRREVGYPELKRWRAAHIDAYGQAFVGTTSISIPETKLKLVAYDDWPVTSGELARRYLRRVFADVKRRPPSPRASGFGWTPPALCRPVRHRPLAYVDIASAYWQMIRPFRPDDVILGDEVFRGSAEWLTPEAVTEDRRLRHAIHGSIFANRIKFYRYGSLVVAPRTNVWSNPTMARYCMQTLHAVCGRLAADTNLHAWMTDAAIVDTDDAEPVTRFLEREWLLASRLKARGSGAVLNATTYQVGDKASLNLVHGTVRLLDAEPCPLLKVKRVPVRQLQAVRRRVAA